jgi:hypothetical protein
MNYLQELHAATEYKVDVIGGDTTVTKVNHQHYRNWRSG